MEGIFHAIGKFVLIIIYVYANLATSSITKRRLCLSYRMRSSWGNVNIFYTTAAHSEHSCMMKCIRNPDCWAFNFFHDGTCELLAALGDCVEPRSQLNSTFVHLSTCDGETPVDLSPRNWTENECLTWIPHNKDLVCPPGLLRVTSDGFCLSLAPSRGLYMPGWFHSPHGFRFVTTNQTTQRCPDGYVVKAAVGCTTAWQNYTAGDPVPPNAVQVSVWKDGTSLYSVAYSPNSIGYFIGYYLPTSQKVYYMGGAVFSPTDVKILVLN